MWKGRDDYLFRDEFPKYIFHLPNLLFESGSAFWIQKKKLKMDNLGLQRLHYLFYFMS